MPDLSTIRQRLLQLSLELGAIKVDMNFPFRWASGYMMPIYNDSRLLLALPEARGLIADGFAELSHKMQQIQNVIGVATGGIPHAAILAERLQLPMQYVRSNAKSHGLSRKIEGLPRPSYAGETAIVIEDVISTGESSLQALQAVQQNEANVLGCLAIYSYNFATAKQAFQAANLNYQALLSFEGLLQHLEKTLDAEQIEKIRHWHKNPFTRKAPSIRK